MLLARFQHDRDIDAKQRALAELADALECLVPQMDDHFYEVEAHNTAACWNIYLGRYDEGRNSLQQAKSILDRHTHLRLSLLEASFQEAASVVEMACGDMAKGLEASQSMYDIRRKLLGEDALLTLHALRGLVLDYQNVDPNQGVLLGEELVQRTESWLKYVEIDV